MLNWPARAAIRAVPPHAVVSQRSVEAVEAVFTDADDLEERVDQAFTRIDQRQPALARYLARTLDGIHDDTAQALGHYLGVAVHEAFRHSFGDRIGALDESSFEVARGSLEVDEDLRKGSPDESLESDDVVALGQPHLVAFLRAQIEAALEPDEDGVPADADLDAVHFVYRAMLVVVLALSHAVAPPAGVPVARRMLA